MFRCQPGLRVNSWNYLFLTYVKAPNCQNLNDDANVSTNKYTQRERCVLISNIFYYFTYLKTIRREKLKSQALEIKTRNLHYSHPYG